jgi:integrase
MARPRKSEAPDLSQPRDLTIGAIERLVCPAGRAQAFLRDSKGNGLRVRVTRSGSKSFVWEQSFKNRTIRRTIGDVSAWTIDAARAEARRLSALLDSRTDPRELERQQQLEKEQQRNRAEVQAAQLEAEATAAAVTVGQAWRVYIAERRPHWRERTYFDHQLMVVEAGTPHARFAGRTRKAGPLIPLMSMRLCDLTPEIVHEWAKREAVERPARARLGLRMLKAFLRWAALEPAYRDLAKPEAANSKKARDVLGKPMRRDDVLQREQLAAWFAHVRLIPNQTISAYLQCLLLTGARREELMRLRWKDVNFQWKGMRIADKVHDEGREVPLTPHVEALIAALPRRNEWVFASVRVVDQDAKNTARRERYHASRGQTPPAGDVLEASASGHISEPSIAHRRACAAAGLEGLTLHGLRRSFASLCEWLDIPGGVSAQIQGHAPQGVREQNYIGRPLDLLRVHHRRIEAWILEQAGIGGGAGDPANGVAPAVLDLAA